MMEHYPDARENKEIFKNAMVMSKSPDGCVAYDAEVVQGHKRSSKNNKNKTYTEG